MNQCWVYHPEHEAKIVDEAEGRVLMLNGWYDNPAKFPSLEIPRETLEKKHRKSGSKKMGVTDANSG